MKTFFFTSIFWLFVLGGGWIYLTTFQPQILENLLDIPNPSLELAQQCLDTNNKNHTEIVDSLSTIMTTLQEMPTASNTTGTVNTTINTIDSITEIGSGETLIIDNTSLDTEEE